MLHGQRTSSCNAQISPVPGARLPYLATATTWIAEAILRVHPARNIPPATSSGRGRPIWFWSMQPLWQNNYFENCWRSCRHFTFQKTLPKVVLMCIISTLSAQFWFKTFEIWHDSIWPSMDTKTYLVKSQTISAFTDEEFATFVKLSASSISGIGVYEICFYTMMWKVFHVQVWLGFPFCLLCLFTFVYGMVLRVGVYSQEVSEKGMMEDSFWKPRNKVLKHRWAIKKPWWFLVYMGLYYHYEIIINRDYYKLLWDNYKGPH